MKKKLKIYYIVYLIALSIISYPIIQEFFSIIGSRIDLEYDIEWMEGFILTTANFLVEGKNIYLEPTAEYIPSLYPPFYYLMLSLFISFIPKIYFAGRILSLLSFLGVLFLVFKILNKRYKIPNSAFAIIFILSTFSLTGYWFDVIRVDNLNALLLILTLYIHLIINNKITNSLLSSLLIFICIITKQSGVLLIAPIMLSFFLLKKFQALTIFFSSITLILSLFITVMQRLTNGFFWKYTWELGIGHNYIGRNFWDSMYVFYKFTIVGFPYLNFYITILFITYLSVGLKYFKMKKIPKYLHEDLVILLFSSSLHIMTLRLSIHPGTFLNNNIPMILGMALSFPICMRYSLDIVRKIIFHLLRESRKNKIKFIKNNYRFIYTYILPPIILLPLINNNYNNTLKIMNRTLIPGSKQSIDKLKSILEISESAFSEQISVNALTKWRLKSNYHGMSYDDIKRDSRLKNYLNPLHGIEDVLNREVCIVIKPKCKNHVTYKMSDLGIDSIHLIPLTGALIYPVYIQIRKGSEQKFNQFMENN